jgi:hypothetical protein
MPVAPLSQTAGFGVAFLVAAGIVYEIIAAACSSPQTTEINADKRAETLMKWVYIGLVQAGIFIFLAAKFDPGHRQAIVTGGALAAAIMYVSYAHAKSAGLKNAGAATEYY